LITYSVYILDGLKTDLIKPKRVRNFAYLASIQELCSTDFPFRLAAN